MALLPEYRQEMKHEPALFLVAEGWNALEYNCSQVVAETIRSTWSQAFEQGQNVTLAQTLVDGMKQANRNVYQTDQQLRLRDPDLHGDLFWYEGPVTCTVVAISEQTASLAHVGWCRAYLLRQGYAKQLTEDHTVVASLVHAGMITPQEAKIDPRRDQIYRHLGGSPEVDVDTFEVRVHNGDILALCTHHLTEFVQEEELSRMIRPERLQPSVQELIQEARKRIAAGKDGEEYSAFCNLTLMAVSISLPEDED